MTIRRGNMHESIGCGRVGYLPMDMTISEIKLLLEKAGLGSRPHRRPDCDGKVTLQWNIVDDENPLMPVVASIYDYKGRRWSVGGKSSKALELLQCLGFPAKPEYPGAKFIYEEINNA